MDERSLQIFFVNKHSITLRRPFKWFKLNTKSYYFQADHEYFCALTMTADHWKSYKTAYNRVLYRYGSLTPKDISALTTKSASLDTTAFCTWSNTLVGGFSCKDFDRQESKFFYLFVCFFAKANQIVAGII